MPTKHKVDEFLVQRQGLHSMEVTFQLQWAQIICQNTPQLLGHGVLGTAWESAFQTKSNPNPGNTFGGLLISWCRRRGWRTSTFIRALPSEFSRFYKFVEFIADFLPESHTDLQWYPGRKGNPHSSSPLIQEFFFLLLCEIFLYKWKLFNWALVVCVMAGFECSHCVAHWRSGRSCMVIWALSVLCALYLCEPWGSNSNLALPWGHCFSFRFFHSSSALAS